MTLFYMVKFNVGTYNMKRIFDITDVDMRAKVF